MGFASQITDTVTLSNGTDTAVIKKLGWKAREAALGEVQRQALLRVASFGSDFAAVQSAIAAALEKQGGAEAVKAAVEKDPFLQFDKQTLLERGIVSWTLSAKPTAEEIADLDPADAELVARRIVALFHESQEARKND